VREADHTPPSSA